MISQPCFIQAITKKKQQRKDRNQQSNQAAGIIFCHLHMCKLHGLKISWHHLMA